MCLELTLIDGCIVDLMHTKVIMRNSIHCYAFFLSNHLLRTLLSRVVPILFANKELVVLVSHRPIVHGRLVAHAEVCHSVCQRVTNLYLFFQS